MATFAALVSRSPLSPTEMFRTSFWTLISLMGFANFFSEACISQQPKTNQKEKKKSQTNNKITITLNTKQTEKSTSEPELQQERDHLGF